MPNKFTLGKNERLKSRKSIEQLFKEGTSFSAAPFRVYYLGRKLVAPAGDQPLQFGVGVAVKNFRKATDRNRAKRIVKEAYRLQKHALQEKLKEKFTGLNLFFIYTGKEIPEYKEVYEKTGLILKKLAKIINDLK